MYKKRSYVHHTYISMRLLLQVNSSSCMYMRKGAAECSAYWICWPVTSFAQAHGICVTSKGTKRRQGQRSQDKDHLWGVAMPCAESAGCRAVAAWGEARPNAAVSAVQDQMSRT